MRTPSSASYRAVTKTNLDEQFKTLMPPYDAAVQQAPSLAKSAGLDCFASRVTVMVYNQHNQLTIVVVGSEASKSRLSALF